MPGWTETPLDADEAHRHPYELWYASPPGAAEIGAPRPDRYYPQIVALELSVSGKTTPLGAFLSRAHAAWQALTRPAPAGGSAPFVATPHDAAYAFAALMRAIHAGEAARTELLLFLRGDLLQSPLERHLPRPENAALAVTSAQILRGDTGLTPVRGCLPPEGSDTALLALLETALTAGTALPPRPSEAPPVGVVIDHAIGFANQVFRRRTPKTASLRSRFIRFWAQGDGLDDSPGIGTALDAARINRALHELTDSPYRTEADLYERLGLAADGPDHHHLKKRASHGTAVGHVAFGTDPDAPEAGLDGVDLMGIQLPAASVARTNGHLHDLYVISGLNWLWYHRLQEAIAGRPAPDYLVTHSFGTFAGRHDGLDGLSAEFDRRLDAGEIRAVAAAAGNSLQSATHARLTAADLADSAKCDIGLAIQPDDRSASFVQLWSDLAAPAGASGFPVGLSLTLPDGTRLDPPQGGFRPGHAYDYAMRGQTVARLYCQRSLPRAVPGAQGHERRRLTLAIPATADGQGRPGTAPEGLWRLRLGPAEQGFADQVALWVERGETPEGFAPAGRQAYLEHPAYLRFDAEGRRPAGDTGTAPIKRFGTLSAAAGSRGVITAGSCRASDASVSAFSSASAGPDPAQPTCAAVSEASDIRPDILVTGTYSGSTVAVRGTSFAAPFALRTALARLLTGAPGTPREILTRSLAPSEADPRHIGQGRVPGMFSPTPDRFTRR
ncbi:hypothetical protein [Marinovum algicola]|uniref:hypothetical protein n=1 Tax=Marinovum algicola TaxID=42444 RepID=UPI0032EF618F